MKNEPITERTSIEYQSNNQTYLNNIDELPKYSISLKRKKLFEDIYKVL
jgi:hypothetical protein